MKLGTLLTFAFFAIAGLFPLIAMAVNEMVSADTGSFYLFYAKTVFKWKSM